MKNFFIVLILLLLSLMGFRLYKSYTTPAVLTSSTQVGNRANVAQPANNPADNDFVDSADIAPTYVDLDSDELSTSAP